MKKFALISLLFFFVSNVSIQADVARTIDKNTKTLHSFKVTKKKLDDEIIITVTVPKQMEGEVFKSLSYRIDDKERISTNGTQLVFVTNPAQLEEAIALVHYFDPHHDPEETGGSTVYVLNLSDLAVESR